MRSKSGSLVLAIRQVNGELIGGSTGDTKLMQEDLLICMGTAEQLQQLNQILSPIQSRLLRPPKTPNFHRLS